MEITVEKYSELLKTEAGKKEVVRNLKSLARSKGWNILMLYFNELLKTQEELLHNINSPIDARELQKIRIRLYYIKEVMEMPEILVEGILKSDEEDIPNDIYD